MSTSKVIATLYADKAEAIAERDAAISALRDVIDMLDGKGASTSLSENVRHAEKVISQARKVLDG